jgi:hypothetical protein
MFTRIFGNLIGLILGLCCLFGLSLPEDCQLSLSGYREYTKEQLETGLVKLEIICNIADSEKNIETEVVYDAFTIEEQQEIIEMASNKRYNFLQPRFVEKEYGIRFCYEDRTLAIYERYIWEEHIDGTRIDSFCASMPKDLYDLIMRYVPTDEEP